jgi:hypothetical protein
MTQCKVCTHPDRDEYERKITTKELSMSAAAEAIGCNKSTVSRHMRGCLKALDVERVNPEIDVAAELACTYSDVVDMCEWACRLKTQDAARLLAERRKWLELIAKLDGQF